MGKFRSKTRGSISRRKTASSHVKAGDRQINTILKDKSLSAKQKQDLIGKVHENQNRMSDQLHEERMVKAKGANARQRNRVAAGSATALGSQALDPEVIYGGVGQEENPEPLYQDRDSSSSSNAKTETAGSPSKPTKKAGYNYGGDDWYGA